MTTKSKDFVRNSIGLGAVVATGAAGGLLIAWLKISFGVSPYWFVGVGTGLAVLTTAWVARLLTRLPEPVFVLDWVVAVEGLIAFAVVSVLGLITLAGLVCSGTVFVLISVVLVGLALTIIAYVLNHAPATTWNDDAGL